MGIVFSGGNGDGTAAGGYTQTQNAQVRSVFSGGNGDGNAIHDALSYLPMGNFVFWRGTTSSSFATTSNWTGNTLPGANSDIAFADNASRDLELGANLSIGNLSFNGSKKKLALGSFTLTTHGDVLDADSFSYIQTNGTGVLKLGITSGSSNVFQVGNTAYNPVTITNKTGATDTFNVKVADAVLYKATSGNVISEPHVSRTWFINKKSANTGGGVDLHFRWNSNEVTTGLGSPKLYHFDGSIWQKQTGTTSSTARTLTYTGYTGSFSPFAIGDDIVLLPITLLNFQCGSNSEGSVQLQWSTATEQNSRRFLVERSPDGQRYNTIGEVNAAGQSQTPRKYSFTDLQPLPDGGYYRIKMEDIYGAFSYSEICVQKTNANAPKAPLKMFPNPANRDFYMMALEPERNFNWEIFTATGKLVGMGKSKDGMATTNLMHLSEGIYMIKIVGSGLSENHRIVIRR